MQSALTACSRKHILPIAAALLLAISQAGAVTLDPVSNPPLLQPQGPDLVVDSFHTPQLKVNHVVQAAAFGVVIKNMKGTASKFTVRITASQPVLFDAQLSMCPGWNTPQTGILPSNVHVDTLGPSETRFITFVRSGNSVAPTRAGQCTYTVQVDSANTVKESIEGNNTKSVTVSVAAE